MKSLKGMGKSSGEVYTFTYFFPWANSGIPAASDLPGPPFLPVYVYVFSVIHHLIKMATDLSTGWAAFNLSPIYFNPSHCLETTGDSEPIDAPILVSPQCT